MLDNYVMKTAMTHMWDNYTMRKTHMWDRVKVLKRWWQAVPVVDLGKHNATDGNTFPPKDTTKLQPPNI